MARTRFVIAASLFTLGVGATPALPPVGEGRAWAARRPRSAEAKARGRRRLRAGAAWAARGRCDRAIAELTVAYELLGDPVILFNRGECWRKLGRGERAIEDYEAYLAGVPRAPNRGQVQARVAELRARETTPAPSRVVARAPIASEPAAPPAPVEAPSLPEPRLPAARAEPEPSVTLLAAPARRESAPTGRGGAWFALAAAVALAAGGAAAWWLTHRDATDVPPSSLGGYRF